MPKSKHEPSTVDKLLLRAPAVRKISNSAVPAYVGELARLWDGHEGDHPNVTGANRELADRIRRVLAANRAKLGARGGPMLMERLANSLPEPAVAYSVKGHTYNAAFDAAFAECPDKASAVREALAPLDRMSEGNGTDLRSFLYPLGSGVYSLRVVRLAAEDLTLYYFSPTDLVTPELPFAARFICCARLNGLPLKQIALLIGMTFEQVERLSKKHRPEYLRMKRDMA